MESEDAPVLKRPRTSEDFYLFCTYILEHENYERQKQEELRKQSASPMDSAGSLVSDSNFSSGQEDNIKPTDEDSGQYNNYVDSESWDLVTCYCNKPFAGRAMIECTNCLTWVHLSCAKIRKTHIPDVFYCALCKAGGKSGDSSHSNSPNGEGTSNSTQSSVTSASGSPASPRNEPKPATKSVTPTKPYQRLSQSQSPPPPTPPSDAEARRHPHKAINNATTAILKRPNPYS